MIFVRYAFHLERCLIRKSFFILIQYNLISDYIKCGPESENARKISILEKHLSRITSKLTRVKLSLADPLSFL